MSDWNAYWFVVVGVVAAVLIPVLKGLSRGEFPKDLAGPLGLPPWVIQYGSFGLLALLVAGVVFALWKSTHPNGIMDWPTAVLLGFSSESVIEKIGKPS